MAFRDITEIIKEFLRKIEINFNKQPSAERLDLWIYKFKNYNGDSFKQACLQIIENEKRFPSIAVVQEYYSRINKNYSTYSNQFEYCEACKGSGYISFKDRNGYDFVAFCKECENGRIKKAQAEEYSKRELGQTVNYVYYQDLNLGEQDEQEEAIPF